MILSKTQILDRIENENMVSEYIDLNTQLTPNGFDLTMNSIYKFDGTGRIDFNNKERLLPKHIMIEESDTGSYLLTKGTYIMDLNEMLRIPLDIVGLEYSRSSLLRSGCFTPSAFFDSGYIGHPQLILVVNNDIELLPNARVSQLVFFERHNDGTAYNGVYQENKLR